MRHISKILAAAAILACCMMLDAKTLTLPNGKVLEDPYVMGQRPDGLDVGHKHGVMFIKFTDLPAEIQKKYNYDPAKAAEFEKQVQALKDKRAADLEKKKKDDAILQAKMKENMFNWQFAKLEQEIEKTKIRINFLKTEIPKLEEQYNNTLNKSVALASTTVSSSSSSGSSGGNYAWDGGYVTGGDLVAQRAQDMMKNTMSMVGDEFSDCKKKLNNYKSELAQKQLDIIEMQKRYESMKEQKDQK